MRHTAGFPSQADFLQSGVSHFHNLTAVNNLALFVLEGFKTEEVGKALNQEGIAVRSGHHCAQPILRRFGLEPTVRPSLAFYNTCQEVDHLVATLKRLKGGRSTTVFG
ncbi:aminotransferase class V-fold PLP-dependent enzyme [Azospira sp. I13]|uniref:aminotransferase class V-fold PLP-dependent enzyme n=1 Tax=Azospira sp. I13 TaxID=1765050 RepID=UPI00273814CE|nr:aminotransferase class V-fold PLP-dependent enzyme [Azospira sp. I13]